jgi:hypothetical protein
MLLVLRGLFFLVDMSLPVVHSAVTSPLLPFSCQVHCPYLLLCFFYVGFHGSVVWWARSRATLHFIGRQLTGTDVLWAPHCAYLSCPIQKSTPVVPVSTGLVPVVDCSVIQSALCIGRLLAY